MAYTIQTIPIGSILGVVDGPGVFPRDNKFRVDRRVENRWGWHLEVTPLPGNISEHYQTAQTVHSLQGSNDKGIGWYHLEVPV